MRRSAILVLAFVLSFTGSCSRSEEPAAFSVSPAEPEANEELTVEYRPEISRSPLQRSEKIELRVSLLTAAGDVRSEEIPMNRTGDAWTVRLVPGGRMAESPVVMVAAFVDAGDREIFDNNRGNPWVVLFRENGRPAPGAYLQLSRLQWGEA
ncbi:MAG: hypothetical protein ABIH26_06325, partial [Candidatus Eisenbacteria bacterium]